MEIVSQTQIKTGKYQGAIREFNSLKTDSPGGLEIDCECNGDITPARQQPTLIYALT